MNYLKIKELISIPLNIFGISSYKLKRINKSYQNNYIRVLNYHDVKADSLEKFGKQIRWLSQHFENVDYIKFDNYMNKKYNFTNRPGIMITFDDGYIGNSSNALSILKKNNMTGYFFVSSDLIGKAGYMNTEQIEKLIMNKNIIGCHTATHHRMCIDDSQDILNYEIIESKKRLENIFGQAVDIFCWCGGEEWTYTKNAALTIKNARYKYSFMTNSWPVTSQTNFFQLERTNCEDAWSISVLKFQICGFMDKRFMDRRIRIEKLTNI